MPGRRGGCDELCQRRTGRIGFPPVATAFRRQISRSAVGAECPRSPPLDLSHEPKPALRSKSDVRISSRETYGELLVVLDQLAREAVRLGDDAICEWTELAQSTRPTSQLDLVGAKTVLVTLNRGAMPHERS